MNQNTVSEQAMEEIEEAKDALTEHDKDRLRNWSAEIPNLSLKDLALISGTLLEAARSGSVCAYSIGRKFGVSDAYADMLLRSLCAAHLMFLHGDGNASLDVAFYKPVAAHHDRVAELDILEKSRGR